MTTTKIRQPHGSRETRAMLATLARYGLAIFPVARAEIAHWRQRAATIPDPTLRRHALGTLAEEHFNAEGAAIFATLAPRTHRTLATRLLVRYQVMYDYLDTLTEQPLANPLATSRHLHRALTAALGGRPPTTGYYTHYPHTDDGGYLAELVTDCHLAFQALPASSHVAAVARRAARRSAEAQSQNHAAIQTSSTPLVRWAAEVTPPDSGLYWWETAAAAASSLAIHALLAAAADPTMDTAAAEQIEAAYWPWINGLNTLLESMIDAREDAETGNPSYVAHYAGPAMMATRLDTIARQASDAARRLSRPRQHAAILTGMAAFYLAAPDAQLPPARAAARRVRDRIGPRIGLPLAMLRARHLLGGFGGRAGPAGSRRRLGH